MGVGEEEREVGRPTGIETTGDPANVVSSLLPPQKIRKKIGEHSNSIQSHRTERRGTCTCTSQIYLR